MNVTQAYAPRTGGACRLNRPRRVREPFRDARDLTCRLLRSRPRTNTLSTNGGRDMLGLSRSRRPVQAALLMGLLVLLVAAAAAGGAPAAAGGDAQTFIVLAPGGVEASQAVARIGATGGTVVARYDAIGVVIARSDRADFATAVVGNGVQSAAATTGLGTPIETDETVSVDAPDPATTGEPLWSRQWDMRAIQVEEAHSVTIGSPDVVVGVLDSGIDDLHPDLAPQVDDSLSASCLGGSPNTNPGAWRPTTSDHGTHVAGTI